MKQIVKQPGRFLACLWKKRARSKKVRMPYLHHMDRGGREWMIRKGIFNAKFLSRCPIG